MNKDEWLIIGVQQEDEQELIGFLKRTLKVSDIYCVSETFGNVRLEIIREQTAKINQIIEGFEHDREMTEKVFLINRNGRITE